MNIEQLQNEAIKRFEEQVQPRNYFLSDEEAWLKEFIKAELKNAIQTAQQEIIKMLEERIVGVIEKIKFNIECESSKTYRTNCNNQKEETGDKVVDVKIVFKQLEALTTNKSDINK